MELVYTGWNWVEVLEGSLAA